MDYNEETIKIAMNRFLSNPEWKEKYDNAPAGAKKRMRIAFWGSSYSREGGAGTDAYREARERCERDEMTVEDAAYLAKHMPDGNPRDHYRQLMDDILLRPLRTNEALDKAMDVLTSGWGKNDIRLFEETRSLMRELDDPVLTYLEFWKATGGDGDACCLLGEAFEHGHGLDKDAELAEFWYTRGAKCGDGECIDRLIWLLDFGETRSEDFKKTVFWYFEGVRRNRHFAKCKLAYRMALSPQGGQWSPYLNPELAISLLNTCLDNDPDGYAHYYLGLCFEESAGVERDIAKAMEFYCEAIRLGNVDAKSWIARKKDKR